MYDLGSMVAPFVSTRPPSVPAVAVASAASVVCLIDLLSRVAGADVFEAATAAAVAVATARAMARVRAATDRVRVATVADTSRVAVSRGIHASLLRIKANLPMQATAALVVAATGAAALQAVATRVTKV